MERYDEEIHLDGGPQHIEEQSAEQRQNDIHRASFDRTGFWGARAAGCLFLAKSTGRIMFAHRSDEVKDPDLWSTFGGAIDEGEDPATAVRREIEEETGYDGPVRMLPLAVFKHESGFRYFNFLAIVPEEFEPELNWENQDYAWVEYGNFPEPLHMGAVYLLNQSATAIKLAIKEM